MPSTLPPNAQYNFKHLHRTINELVTGPEEARRRLIYAGEHFVCIHLGAVPEHLQPQARRIRDYLTKYKAEPGATWPLDSDVRVTMKRRRNSSAVKIARAMWSLYHQYRDALEAERSGPSDTAATPPTICFKGHTTN